MKENSREKSLEKEIEELRKEIQELAATIKQFGEQADASRPTGPKAEILRLLQRHGKPMSVREIAEEVGLAETTVSGYTLDLYKGGFLDRGRRLVQVSPSRRVRQLEYHVPSKRKKKWHYVD